MSFPGGGYPSPGQRGTPVPGCGYSSPGWGGTPVPAGRGIPVLARTWPLPQDWLCRGRYAYCAFPQEDFQEGRKEFCGNHYDTRVRVVLHPYHCPWFRGIRWVNLLLKDDADHDHAYRGCKRFKRLRIASSTWNTCHSTVYSVLYWVFQPNPMLQWKQRVVYSQLSTAATGIHHR